MDKKDHISRDNVDFSFFKTPWDGWYFKNGMLWDDAGNMYSENDIRMSWKSGMIVDNFFGTSSDILTLRQELDKRILMNRLPKVCFVWKSKNGVIEKVFDLEESF